MALSNGIRVFGEVLFDCFPDGYEVLGGAPFNVAWHLQAFSLAPMFVSCVGDDAAGQCIRDAMAGWGMDQSGLQVDPHHPTGRVAITLDGGEPAYEIVADCAYDFIASDALPHVDPDLIYHGSLALRNPVSEAALAALKSRPDARVFIDVNLRAPRRHPGLIVDLFKNAHWVKLNREEFRLLGDGGDADMAAAERFRTTHGLEGLVVTLGADGAMAAASGQEPVRVVPRAVAEVVDAVGAGDAFAALLILGLRLGWPLATTMERAQDFASELVQRQGATQADRALYQALCRQWDLTIELTH